MKRLPFLLAALFSLLVLVEFFLSHPEAASPWVFVSRCVAIGILWLMAVVITQRRHAEVELRKLNAELEQRVNERTVELQRRKQELEDFLENATEGLHWVDGGGKIIWANQAELDLLGYTREEYLEHQIAEFHADQEVINDILTRLLRGEKLLNREARLRCKDGSLKHVLINSNTLVEGGKFIHTRCFTRDITERKHFEQELERRVEERTRELQSEVWEHQQAEALLSESKNRFRSLMQTANDAIIVADAQERILNWNKGALAMFGYTEEEALGQPVNLLMSERYREAHRERVARFAATGGAHLIGKTVELHGLRKDGSEFPAELSLSSWKAHGEVFFSSIIRDITGRKQAEESLAQTEYLFRSFMDGIPDMIYFKDTQGRFIRANKAIANRFGQPNPEALLGKTDFDFFLEEHARAAHEDEQGIIRTGQPLMNREERETWPGREDTWVSTSKWPLRDPAGKIVGIFGISRDITERKRAEDQIREQARLLDLAHDAIIVRDLEDRILYWNRAAESILGWTAKESVGQKITSLLYKESSKFAAAKKAFLEKGEWDGELTVQDKGQQEVLLHSRWTLVRDSHGIPKSVLTISTDITEKRKLELQTLRSQRMESIGTLAGGIAHDLNNVLTPLLMSIELLKEKVADARGQYLLGTLEANAERGAKLVKQVLTFGRGVKGERVTIEPRRIVREIEQMMRETFPKLIELEIRSAPDLWTVTGDATQLYQVLLNLCVNARDAMPNGGKLSIHTENVVLDEMYAAANVEAKPGPYVVVSVRDTGTGIPKEIQDKIFEPFFTTKELGKGTGLGLSTCFSIVKNHGGFIHCYSEAGTGSAFKVYLPANTTAAAAENVATEQSKLPYGRNELVLVVDDEETIREVAHETLERFGYRVLTAVNGAEAVSLYEQRQHEIAVVVTDMVMPIMDGPAAIVALKSINPNVRIIGTSGLDSEDGMAKAMKAGVEHFIRKPHTAEALLRALHSVLTKEPAQ